METQAKRAAAAAAAAATHRTPSPGAAARRPRDEDGPSESEEGSECGELGSEYDIEEGSDDERSDDGDEPRTRSVGNASTARPRARHGKERARAQEAAAGEGGSEDESSEDECSEDGNGPRMHGTGKAAGAAGSASTTRPRARHGNERARASSAAAGAGKADIPNLFERSSSEKNWHGLGGQAKAAATAAGRARPFGGLDHRSKGQACVSPCLQQAGFCSCPAEATYPDRCSAALACALQLDAIVEGACIAGARTPSEIVNRCSGRVAKKCCSGRVATAHMGTLHV